MSTVSHVKGPVPGSATAVSESPLVTISKPVTSGVGEGSSTLAPASTQPAASSPEGSINPFSNHLSITQRQITSVRNIIEKLDTFSLTQLMLPSYQKQLKQAGEEVATVHPLCFMWAILSDEASKQRLQSIKEGGVFNTLKWNGFLGVSTFHKDGFVPHMERFYGTGNCHESFHELTAFYTSLKLNPEKMNVHADKQDWKAFANALLMPGSYLS